MITKNDEIYQNITRMAEQINSEIKNPFGKKPLHQNDNLTLAFINQSKNKSSKLQIETLKNPDNQERIKKLIREYNLELTARGFAHKRSQLRNMNLIDLTFLKNKNESDTSIQHICSSEKDADFLKRESLYAVIPCFEECVFQVNTCRYFYIKLIDLDLKEKKETLFLHDYMYLPTTGWDIGTSLNVTLQFETAIDINLNISNPIWYTELYRYLKQNDLPWGEKDWKLWQTYIISHSEKSKRYLIEKNQDPLIQLYKLCIICIVKTNRLLQEYKPKTKEPNKTKPKTTSVKSDVSEKTENQRKIHMVGPVTIHSKQAPKPSIQERIVHYKTASWEVRGHIRTYKSGKTVYIRPQTRKRKNTEAKTVQKTTIKFRKDVDA